MLDTLTRPASTGPNNVVTLSGSTGVGDQPVAEVVDYCEKLLADARSGALRAVATAEVRQGGKVGHGFAYGSYQLWTLGGAVLILQSLFADKFKELT